MKAIQTELGDKEGKEKLEELREKLNSQECLKNNEGCAERIRSL